MVGKSDPGSYGKLQIFVMPRDQLPKGPALVQGEIQRDPAVSQQETILSGQGSTVSFGSLTAIPLDGGLVYVRPFYVTSTQTEVPGLEKVIVYFEGDVAIRDTLQEALTAVFGNAPPTLEEEDPLAPPPEELTGTLTEQVAQLIAEAQDLFAQADAALPDFADYADLVRQAKEKIADAERLLEDAGAGGPTTTTTPSSTTTTTAPASA
jgi:uncharacterized membrane protein (UPF0182 family)